MDEREVTEAIMLTWTAAAAVCRRVGTEQGELDHRFDWRELEIMFLVKAREIEMELADEEEKEQMNR